MASKSPGEVLAKASDVTVYAAMPNAAMTVIKLRILSIFWFCDIANPFPAPSAPGSQTLREIVPNAGARTTSRRRRPPSRAERPPYRLMERAIIDTVCRMPRMATLMA